MNIQNSEVNCVLGWIPGASKRMLASLLLSVLIMAHGAARQSPTNQALTAKVRIWDSKIVEGKPFIAELAVYNTGATAVLVDPTLVHGGNCRFHVEDLKGQNVEFPGSRIVVDWGPGEPGAGPAEVLTLYPNSFFGLSRQLTIEKPGKYTIYADISLFNWSHFNPKIWSGDLVTQKVSFTVADDSHRDHLTLAPYQAEASAELVSLGKQIVPYLLGVVGTRTDWASKDDRNKDKRVVAIDALGRIGSTVAVLPLIEVLKYCPSIEARGAAAEALGRLKDSRAIPALVSALYSPESRRGYDLSGHSALALVTFGRSALPAVVAAFNSGTAAAKDGAAYVLGKIGGPNVYELLTKRLAICSDERKWAVIIALGDLGDWRAVSPLTKMLGDKSINSAIAAAEALGIGNIRLYSEAPLKRAMKDARPQVRRLAFYSYSSWRNNSAELKALMLLFLRDKAAGVRWQALQVLGYQSDIDGPLLSEVKRLTRDREPRVRAAAREVIKMAKTNWRSPPSALY